MDAYSSPLLDDYNRTGVVTPGLQRAMDLVKQKMGQSFDLGSLNPGGGPAPAPGSPTPTLAPPGPPVPAIPRGTPPVSPAPVPMPRAPGTPVPTIQRDTPLSTPTLIAPRMAAKTEADRADLTRLTAPPPAIPALVHTKTNTGASGIEQIHNPWVRRPLEVLDALGSAFLPALSVALPGTQLHHQGLVNLRQGAVNEDEKLAAGEAAREHVGAQTDEARAAAENYRSEATARNQPKTPANLMEWYRQFYPNNTPEDYAKFEQTVKPNDKNPTHLQDDQGNFWILNQDGSVKPVVAANGNQLKGKTTETKQPQFSAKDAALIRAAGGDPDKPDTITEGVLRKVRDMETEKPPAANEGTWTLEEDQNGNPVKFNNKTGEVQPANGIQKPGTHAKQEADQKKATEPTEGAIGYARDYLKNGTFTGSGDEALQEKFFELAKPSTGFRMTQPQIDMLQKSRSWMNSLSARLRHATTGTWFSDDQRKEILNTMEDLAKAKLAATGKGGQSGANSGGTQGHVIQIGDKRYRYNGNGDTADLKNYTEIKGQK